MNKKQIIDRVKTIMEEVTPFDDGLAVLQADVKPITSYIEDCLQSSCDELMMICPLHLTKASALSTGGMTSVMVDKKKVGTLSLPGDFVRLHTFKMRGWERPVNRPISVENPQYMHQFNPTLRGGNAKPVIAKKSSSLEIFTFNDGDTVETALYVSRVDLTDNSIQINPKLVEPFCFLVAANVYKIFGSQQAKVMVDQVDNLLKAEL